MLDDPSHAEKHLRAMHRELTLLQHRLKNSPVQELHPPIQHGWKRHFIMTPTARERPDAATLESILAHLNTVRYFWRPDFRYSRRQASRRGLVSIEQELMAIHWCDWQKETIYEPWRKYFRCELVPNERLLNRWSGGYQAPWNYPRLVSSQLHFTWAYVFRFSLMFELRVERHWLTHCTEIDGEVVSRVAEIERWMEHHRGHKRFGRLKGKSQSWARRTASAWGRLDRQMQREVRAHLGMLGDEAADHIPSATPCGGHGGWDVFSRFVIAVRTFFCGSEAGDTSPTKTRRPRPGSLTGYRHSGQGSQALASRGRPFRVGPRRAFPRKPDARVATRRRRLPVQSSSKRAGSTPAGFLRKNKLGALAMAVRRFR